MTRMKIALTVLLTVCLATIPGIAADRNLYENNSWIQHHNVAGSRDYPLISSFSGSIIQYYKTLKWDKYTLPVSPIVSEGGEKSGFERKFQNRSDKYRVFFESQSEKEVLRRGSYRHHRQI